jgi:uncharacterized protein (DUF1778 family)
MEALKKDEVIGLRLSSVNKNIISIAASFKGQDVTNYVLGLVMDDAMKVIKEHKEVQKIVLSNEDFDQVMNAIENPDEPTPRLKRVAKKLNP